MRCRTERSQAGTAGRDENPPLRLPRPTGRTKHWRTGRGAPDRPDGGKYRCCERQYRTARHKPDLAPSAPDRIPRSPTTWTRRYSLSLVGTEPFRGWSPILASESGHLPLHLTAGIEGGVRPLAW